MDSTLTLAEICISLVVAAHAGVLALRLSVSLFKA
ncbi:MAG: photosystem I reaction center subunit XII [Prochlorococcus sp.]|nr:photosystem I reaction center subunit XII [Prochlorococcaceae cyanobacterium Fu_MAG_50]